MSPHTSYRAGLNHVLCLYAKLRLSFRRGGCCNASSVSCVPIFLLQEVPNQSGPCSGTEFDPRSIAIPSALIQTILSVHRAQCHLLHMKGFRFPTLHQDPFSRRLHLVSWQRIADHLGHAFLAVHSSNQARVLLESKEWIIAPRIHCAEFGVSESTQRLHIDQYSMTSDGL